MIKPRMNFVCDIYHKRRHRQQICACCLSDDDIADLLIEGVITTETDMPEVLREK